MAIGLAGSSTIKNKNLLVFVHLLLPLIVVLYVNCIAIRPSIVSPSLLAASPIKLVIGGTLVDWNKLLPLSGTTRQQAWLLGECEGKLLVGLDTSNSKAIDSAISYTESAINNITITNKSKPIDTMAYMSSKVPKERAQSLLSVILKAKETTLAHDHGKSIMSYMSKMFSFINIIWLISIIGIVVSIGPFCAVYLSILVQYIGIIAITIWYGLIVHIWRPLFYVLVLLMFTSTCDNDVSTDVKVYTSLSAALLYCMTILFTCNQLVEVEALKAIDDIALLLFPFFIFLPLTIITSSSLLGFMTVVILYLLLGFGMMSVYGGYVIGFTSEDQLIKCAISSAYLLLLQTSCQVSGFGATQLLPFKAGLQCLGGTSLYIALLIKSSCYMPDSNHYLGLYIIALLLGIVIGNIVPLLALRNTSYVFVYLFMLDRASFYSSRAHASAAVLITSILLYIGCMLLNQYPEVVVSLYCSD